MNTYEMRQTALRNATTSQSLSNYPMIYQQFMEMGIPEDEIRPRENVFTLNAWRALGRRVKKGVHGVKICTWVPTTATKKNDKGERVEVTRTMPWSTTVFHVSQTEAV